MKRFTLRYPPSANRYWRMGQGHIHKSDEARVYQRGAVISALAAGVRPQHGEVAVCLDVYRPAKRGDLDNTMKVLLDALKGIAYEDDDQIVHIQARRFDDKANPRVEVTVGKAPTASPLPLVPPIGALRTTGGLLGDKQ